MTMMAGIFTRSQEHPLAQFACEALKKLISRHLKDEIKIFKDGVDFVKVDIGA